MYHFVFLIVKVILDLKPQTVPHSQTYFSEINIYYLISWSFLHLFAINIFEKCQIIFFSLFQFSEQEIKKKKKKKKSKK